MKLFDFAYSDRDLKKLIKNPESYFAHISFDEKRKESLNEHILLVQNYFVRLIEVHKLEKIIINLATRFSDDKVIQEFILELFIKSIAAHDFGKVNPIFQKEKMQNEISNFDHELSSGHSLISGYIFSLLSELTASDKNIPREKESLIDFIILSFSYSILKHHSSKLKYIKTDILYNEKVNDLSMFVKFFNNLDDSNFISEINEFVFQNSQRIFENNNDKMMDQFPIFALIKLNYSLLTASDYYATTHFMSSWKKMPDDFGVITNGLKKKIINNIENSISYNKKTYKELNNYKPEFPKEATTENLNKLRQNLSVEVINGIRENINSNLFYIEAPTGGGKTNLSMLALAEFLRNDIDNKLNNITKVFYVFPFTTLITQTFNSLKKTLGLDNDEIVQIHSKTGFSEKFKDDNYGNEKDNIIDYQFVNYPVALLSHIKFFNILKSNKKSENYLMHRLANSVVIIDELQTYPPKEWDKIIYFINNYAKYFNIKFILMSATLPKIDKLLSSKAKRTKFEKQEFVLLNKNKDKYFTNPNFANRVEFDFEIINDSSFVKKYREKYLQKLWQKVQLESKIYKKKNNRVHAIIEFIFKKTASEFFSIANDKNKLFDEIFILSGTILEPRRKEIIAKLKSDNYQFKNILLITTQVVEAGVDIDMDLGFKDTSLIDSDEQLAGRINRNVNKPKCKLYMFELDDAKVIYGEDDRFKKIKNELKHEYSEILKNKNFDKVYDSVMKDINELNKSDDFINLKDYLSSIQKLDFTTVDKDFKLIHNKISDITIYIPIDLDITIPGSKEKNFAEAELNFLKENNKFHNDDKTISGESIWELYDRAIQYNEEDFIVQKKKMIILQGLMSKFSFSLGVYSNDFKNISSFNIGEEKYGYYFLNHPESVYSYETGINTSEFDKINFF